MEKINLDKFYELVKLSKLEEAEIEINQLLLNHSNNYLLLSHLGSLLLLKGDFLSAIEKFKKSISIKPEHHQNYSDISLCFISLKKFDEVIFFLEEYIKYKKDNCDVYNNLGLAFLEKKNFDEAINCFNKCLLLNFDYIQAYNNLGIALINKGKINEAILILEQGIKIDSKFKKLYFNLGRCYVKKDQILKAIKIFQDNLENSKFDPVYLTALSDCFFNIGRIEKGFFFANKCLEIEKDPNIYTGIIGNQFYFEILDLNNYFNDVKEYRELYLKNVFKSNYFESNNSSKKIKIGFISADLRKHAVSYQIFDVLKILSENKNFEIYMYNNNLMDDEITNDYKKFLSNWYDVKDYNDEKLLDLVRSNNLKILVDLSGFSSGNRMPIFFNRAAPIQVTWCGYLASTGLKEIDYIIADKHTVLPGDENKYSEKVYKLNKTWSVLKPINGIHVNENIPSLKNKFISFASFNHLKKINNTVIKLWSKILCNVKNSRLYLIDKNFSDQEFNLYFRNFFQTNGVLSEQLFFYDSLDRIELLNKYNSIDIALDTFPYSGGTTSLESYWMCVPVLTKKGDYFISKSTESINRNIGLDNWIADDEDDYYSKAIAFSKNLNNLQNIKDYLRKNRDKFVIFNSKDLAKELSLSFLKMIRDYKSA